MIGKPKWFKRRKYGGWGICPQAWQGWLYLFLILVPFVIFQALPFWDIKTRIYVTIGWLLFLGLDVNHIMVTLKRDEREQKIEAFSERNAAWTMVMILVIGVIYEVITSALKQKLAVDWFLLSALFAGMIVKTLSNIMYERRAL
jgi:hypothetical protein